MRRPRLVGVAAVAGAAAVAAAGCGASGSTAAGGGAPTLDAAATHTLIRDPELAVMPLPHDVAASDAPGLTLAADTSGFSDNVRAAHDTIDPEDTPGQVARTGRQRGYSVTFRDDTFSALRNHRGTLEVGTGVTLFGTDEQAHAWIEQQDAAYGRLRGKEVAAAVTLLGSRPFAVSGLGDEAAGTVARYRVGMVRAWTTVLDFRVGRLIGEVVITRGDSRDARGRAEELARDLDRRAAGVLAGTIRATPAAGRTLPGPQVAKPPEGKPDVSGRVLQPEDLPPGARVSREAYANVPNGVVGFRRQFDVGSARIGGARVFNLASGVDVYRTRAEADRSLITLATAYTSSAGPKLLARLFGVDGARARLTAVRRVSAGDAAVALQAEVPSALTRVTGVVVLVASGPRIGTIVATGPTGEFRIADVTALSRKLGKRLAAGSPQKHVAF